MPDPEAATITVDRASTTDPAASWLEMPATGQQLRYLSDLLELSHGALWQTFGTLPRGTASLLISGLVAARMIDEEEAA